MDDSLYMHTLTLATSLSVVVFAVIQMLKMAIPLPKNIVPLIGVVIGMGVGALWIFSDLSLAPRLWGGALAGLSSTGLFELLKPNTGTTKVNKDE